MATSGSNQKAKWSQGYSAAAQRFKDALKDSMAALASSVAASPGVAASPLRTMARLPAEPLAGGGSRHGSTGKVTPGATAAPVSQQLNSAKRLLQEPVAGERACKRVFQPAAKEEDSSVPGFTVPALLKASNEDLWQHSWNVTWQEADAAGTSGDQAKVYEDARATWKGWIAERTRIVGEQAIADGKEKAQAIFLSTASQPAAVKAEASSGVQSEGGQNSTNASSLSQLTSNMLRAQEEQWQANSTSKQDWDRATAKQAVATDMVSSTRDLCSTVKLRCPADQPLSFERLLAVCPKGTTVRQLIQALAKEPKEFRQNWDGSEYCVRPANSRCVDWLPVHTATTPPGFRENGMLPEQMLEAAKAIFEERIKPQGQSTEDPLVQFLIAPGRLPPDTPLPFSEILKNCPPGTQPAELIKNMSKRRDLFRQNPAGTQFCVKPRVKCRDWVAVNPYFDARKVLS